jgi:hypothetical protein
VLSSLLVELSEAGSFWLEKQSDGDWMASVHDGVTGNLVARSGGDNPDHAVRRLWLLVFGSRTEVQA